MTTLIALLSGFVFGIGLIVSGMIHPLKVSGFLDFAGQWDPSLALVMIGALLVATPAYWFAQRRSLSLVGLQSDLSQRRGPDRKVLLGSALFGIGWGLSGICPGPGIVIAARFDRDVLLFVGAMLIGFAIANRYNDTTT